MVLSHSCKVKYVNAKIARIEPVKRLVESAGFDPPLIVGISAIANTQVPMENTQSCQCILDKNDTKEGQ